MTGLHGPGSTIEGVGDLGFGQTEPVAQHDDRALIMGQPVKGQWDLPGGGQ